MSSHGLTEEQRRKIEENRKKALALKAERHCRAPQKVDAVQGCSNGSSSSRLSHSGFQYEKKTNNQFTISSLKPGSFPQKPLPSKNRQLMGNPNVSTSHQGNRAQKSMYPTKTQQPMSAGISKDKFYGFPQKITRGKCVLISKDRFCVDVGFHGPLIDFFKEMETRSYDTSSRTWSFQLKEYDRFYKGAFNFQPDVVIEPLPLMVIQTFCKDVADNGIEEVDLSSIDSDLVNTLMPFQKEGVYFALHHGGRTLLADEMGLGKTLQALCIARYYRSQWPLLIVTPSSVRYDWAQQIYKWLPSVDPQDVNVLDTGRGSVKDGLISIISYDLLPKKIEDLKQKRFKVIIMDESHFLKNSKAVRTKTAAAITALAERVILLSGTPALSRPSELFTQISAVCPKMFKFHDFGVRYCAAKQLPWGWDYSGSSNLEELQLILEKRVMIRRQKSDVLQQLPDKTRQVIVLNPVLISTSNDLNKAYKTMDKTSLKGLDRRGALLQYFHETCRVKLKAVKDFILDLIESDKKFLVFAHHKEMLDCIERSILEHSKIKHIRIDGSTKSESRSQLCRKFQSQEDYRVAVLSITAANAGLNLSAANLVVFAELFWNPGILVQAEDRVHRIGQKNSVSVQYLVARNTADDFVWPLVQDKLKILTKAGLTKDRFSDADTKYALDKSQKGIMEMFQNDFIEDALPDPCDVQEESGNRPSDPCQVTPVKLKRRRSLSGSPSSKCLVTQSPGSPRKRQLRITKFLKTPEKCTDDMKSMTERIAGYQQDTCVPDYDNSIQCNVCHLSSQDGMPLSSETTLLTEEDFEALGDTNWDDDFWS